MALSIFVIKNLEDNTRRIVVKAGDYCKSADELQRLINQRSDEGKSPREEVESFLIRDGESDEAMLKELLDAVYYGASEFFHGRGFEAGSDSEL